MSSFIPKLVENLRVEEEFVVVVEKKETFFVVRVEELEFPI